MFNNILPTHFEQFITAGASVCQSVERWTSDWEVGGLNPELKGPRGTISIFSAVCHPCLSKVTHNESIA